MKKEEWTFIILLSVVLFSLSFCLGESITSYTTLSRYCADGICEDFCRFDSDCLGTGICCEQGNFGVCQEYEFCAKHFLYYNHAASSAPEMFSPSRSNIIIYSVLIILASIIVIIYFLNRQKEIKKKHNKKK